MRTNLEQVRSVNKFVEQTTYSTSTYVYIHIYLDVFYYVDTYNLNKKIR
jgi:hypothetical protein